jgi:hypothetical protein
MFIPKAMAPTTYGPYSQLESISGISFGICFLYTHTHTHTHVHTLSYFP